MLPLRLPCIPAQDYAETVASLRDSEKDLKKQVDEGIMERRGLQNEIQVGRGNRRVCNTMRYTVKQDQFCSETVQVMQQEGIRDAVERHQSEDASKQVTMQLGQFCYPLWLLDAYLLILQPCVFLWGFALGLDCAEPQGQRAGVLPREAFAGRGEWGVRCRACL